MPTATAKKPPRRPRAKKAATPSVPLSASHPVALELDEDDVRAIRAVALAASNDETRRILTALHLVARGGQLAVEAADSYRLHRATAPTKARDFEALVPAAWLVKALREVKLPSTAELRILNLDGTNATLTGRDETRSARLIEGDYPATSNFVDVAVEHHPETTIGVNPKYFTDVLKACDLFGGETCAARLRVQESNLRPMHFEVRHGRRLFQGVLMPLRIDL